MLKMLFKWVGSKRRLVDDILAHMPDSFDYYIEPFFGAGHIGFTILENKMVNHSTYFNDKNVDLGCFWMALRETPDDLWHEMQIMKSKLTKTEFLRIRRTTPKSIARRGARFYYLVQTSYKGLWRVNAKGEFNVAYGGRPEDIFLPDRKEFDRLHALLQNVEITIGDFKEMDLLKKKFDGSVCVYLDPPYLDTFTSFTVDKFLNHDQVVLKYYFEKMKKKGWSVIESNSDTRFIRDLYSDHDIYEVVINHNTSPTGAEAKTELIII